jgi:hypothetical protein
VAGALSPKEAARFVDKASVQVDTLHATEGGERNLNPGASGPGSLRAGPGFAEAMTSAAGKAKPYAGGEGLSCPGETATRRGRSRAHDHSGCAGGRLFVRAIAPKTVPIAILRPFEVPGRRSRPSGAGHVRGLSAGEVFRPFLVAGRCEIFIETLLTLRRG